MDDPGPAPAPASGPSANRGTTAPVVWLIAALVSAAVAIVLSMLSDSHWVAIGAWVLAGPVTITLLAVFVRVDTLRRADPWYAESSVIDWGRRTVVVLSLIGVTLSAWTIADAFARSNW